MDWTAIVLEPLKSFGDWLMYAGPRILGAILVIVVGWLVAGLCRTVLVRLLLALKIDHLAEKAKLSDMLRQGAVQWTFVELLGQLAYWFVLLGVLTVALQSIGVTAASEWLVRLGYFIPKLIVSVVILLFGMLFASFLGAVIRAAGLNAGFPQAYLLGQMVSMTLGLLTVIVALQQLQVVTRTIEVALYILLGACGLAFGLAVGLGSQDMVRETLKEMRERWKLPRSRD